MNVTINNPNNPNAGMWYIQRKADSSYLTWDGWGRFYWTPDAPGGYVGHSRAEAVGIAKHFGAEEDFDYFEVPGALKLADINNFASSLEEKSANS